MPLFVALTLVGFSASAAEADQVREEKQVQTREQVKDPQGELERQRIEKREEARTENRASEQGRQQSEANCQRAGKGQQRGRGKVVVAKRIVMMNRLKTFLPAALFSLFMSITAQASEGKGHNMPSYGDIDLNDDGNLSAAEFAEHQVNHRR